MNHFDVIDKSLFLSLTRTKHSRLEDVNFESFSGDITKNELSPFAEFYIAPFIFLTPNMCINIPLTGIDLNNDTLRQLLCHFQNITVLTSKGIPVEIRFTNLEPKSKEMFTLLMSQKKINPFILDLYRFYGEHDASGDYKYVKFNNKSVNLTCEGLINSIYIKAFDDIWRNIKQIYSDKNYVHLYPNWQFSDQLTNSISFNYFSTACKEVYLCVDNITSRVLELTLSNDK
ncbi:hypothetical protein QFZ81_002924 [Paenibacillus sp. V4I9]|uniref:hypothetical protein n=1 Tax=Paenibacillus sp. V4I9 TaxID=3042308 RepID=UPI0027867F15|nr:hypothetical protein [Paenibacillus sp. V4I9]MDQ0887836.1 hypothetical protein [Paenibacillus sp. V4I9]